MFRITASCSLNDERISLNRACLFAIEKATIIPKRKEAADKTIFMNSGMLSFFIKKAKISETMKAIASLRYIDTLFIPIIEKSRL
jgi:hypothetical protein